MKNEKTFGEIKNIKNEFDLTNAKELQARHDSAINSLNMREILDVIITKAVSVFYEFEIKRLDQFIDNASYDLNILSNEDEEINIAYDRACLARQHIIENIKERFAEISQMPVEEKQKLTNKMALVFMTNEVLENVRTKIDADYIADTERFSRYLTSGDEKPLNKSLDHDLARRIELEHSSEEIEKLNECLDFSKFIKKETTRYNQTNDYNLKILIKTHELMDEIKMKPLDNMVEFDYQPEEKRKIKNSV